MVHNRGDLDARLQQHRTVYPNEIIGCQAVMHTRILCSAQQIAIPHCGRPLPQVGRVFAMRQRLLLLGTC